MEAILIDTDILIDYSKGKDELLKNLFENQKVELYVSAVSVTEFLTDQNIKSQKSEEKALSFLGLFKLAEVNKKVAVKAGELLREKKVDYLGDALIAGTCLTQNYKLASRNAKHFKKIQGLLFYDS
jgi:predicted nucleic acid-binding protein